MELLPRKLKKDPIIEALLEVRFDGRELLPELVVGKLASHSQWSGFAAQRLPVADIPAPIRKHDPNFQYQPVLELRGRENTRVVKIGERVFSYHALAPYPGWPTFQQELSNAIEFVFGAVDQFAATRFGFRYINAFTLEHFVADVTALNFEVTVAEKPLRAPMNLNYELILGEQHITIVRLASKQFVQGVAANATAFLDIDVFTPQGFTSSKVDQAKTWVTDAHTFLEDEFFRMLTKDLKDKLEEKRS
jgi:uncharacterized protein (TIGR04255 family)